MTVGCTKPLVKPMLQRMVLGLLTKVPGKGKKFILPLESENLRQQKHSFSLKDKLVYLLDIGLNHLKFILKPTITRGKFFFVC